MVTVTCEVEKRLTRPKNFPGVYVPWCADKGFIWQEADEVKVEGTHIESLADNVRLAAEEVMKAHEGDDLEAVKLGGSIDIDDVRVSFDYLLEKEDA